MTNEELLQQAKDQVASTYEDAHGYKWTNWKDFQNDLLRDHCIDQLLKASEESALLAIQSAREEGREEGIKGGEATGYDAGYSKGYEQGYESGQADLKSGFDIKKLTAPGR